MKIAFFVEGQTEQIFLEQLLKNYFGHTNFTVNKAKYLGNNCVISFTDSRTNITNHCIIIDCGNDDQVLSKLTENYSKMKQNGYEYFFGLRDLKSKAFDCHGNKK